MAKKKKQTEQVYTSDYKDVIWGGDVLTQVGPGSVSYDIGDLGQLNFDYDNDLRDKVPCIERRLGSLQQRETTMRIKGKGKR
jgi:hypothetical protein